LTAVKGELPMTWKTEALTISKYYNNIKVDAARKNLRNDSRTQVQNRSRDLLNIKHRGRSSVSCT